MGTYDRIAPLPVLIDDVAYERQSRAVSSGFERVSTTIVMRGGGVEGRGEDICYAAPDHDLLPEPGSLGLAGTHTIASVAEQLDGARPVHGRSEHAGVARLPPLGVRERGARPRAAPGRLHARRGRRSRARAAALRRLDARGRARLARRRTRPRVQGRPDSGRVGRGAHGRARGDRPHPRVRPQGALRRHAGRHGARRRLPRAASRSASPTPCSRTCRSSPTCSRRSPTTSIASRSTRPIHSLADVDALPIPIKHLNIKPSRFGPLSRLFECIDTCLERGTELYGGGQFELGVGRGQVQEIASLFYPHTPNDVAPPDYNAPTPVAGLPQSPLSPPTRSPGFGW